MLAHFQILRFAFCIFALHALHTRTSFLEIHFITIMSSTATSANDPSGHGDRRVMATDATTTLGTILKPWEHDRDAVHIAVQAVEAAHDLIAGQRVGLLPDGRASSAVFHVGMVDPWIGGSGNKSTSVRAGEWFWLVVTPGTIRSLSHVWKHPLIPQRVKPSNTLPPPLATLLVAAEDLYPCQEIGVLQNGLGGKIVKPTGRVDPMLRDVVKAGQEFWFFSYREPFTTPSKVESLASQSSPEAKAEQVEAEQVKAEQVKAELAKAEQVKAEEVKTQHDMTKADHVNAEHVHSEDNASKDGDSDEDARCYDEDEDGNEIVVVSQTQKSVSETWIHLFANQFTNYDKNDSGYGGGSGLTYDDLVDGANDYLNHDEYLCRGGLLDGQYVPDEFWDHFENVTGRRVRERERGNFFTCSC